MSTINDELLVEETSALDCTMPRLFRHFRKHIKYSERDFFRKWREAVARGHEKFVNGEISYEDQRIERVREAFGNQDLPSVVVCQVVKTFDEYFN